MPTRRALLMLLAGLAPATAGAFTLTDTAGRTHTLAAYRGRWVLLNVWATWCAPCLAEMPELEALSRAHANLAVLGLCADGQDARRMVQFAAKLKISYPIIAGDEALARQFGVRGYPTSLLYDTAGQRVLTREGPLTRQEVEGVLAAGVGR